MPRNSLRLTKATRHNICASFHLLPHQLIGAEITSLSDRLKDTKAKKELLTKEIEHTKDRQHFKYLLQTELPKLERLIERLANELQRAHSEHHYELSAHLKALHTSSRPETD
jgi:predicted RNase H-like nuclease (RuvC/YqgF family)